MARLSTKLKHAWNAFNGRADELPKSEQGVAMSYSYRPDRTRLFVSNERSIISSVYTRLSIDVAASPIKHIRIDDNDRYLEEINSGLNYCLTEEANIDQGARAFRQDVAMTLFDKGVAAIVPVETSMNPNLTSSFEIHNMRVGEIKAWYPRHIQVNLYNEKLGKREDIVVAKKHVAIVENPLYAVMNEPNSTLQRLILKLNLLDSSDEQAASGKLDLIVQLPYTVKSEARRQQAMQRREDIEFQLRGSQYGIAYVDATEKITQLNRPAENNLLKQVEYLTGLLYTQLGLTEEVMNGTADEKAMINYNNRTIQPVLEAITQAMHRAFLTKTARTQGQAVKYFTDSFSLVPVGEIAEIADKFTRNEILTSNEVRQILGIKPADDPKADELRNSNMPEAKDSGLPKESEEPPKSEPEVVEPETASESR
jgi:hypothetical protein